MIVHIARMVRSWAFLRLAGASCGFGVVVEGSKRVSVASGLSVGDGVRIRSRCQAAPIRIGTRVRIREFSEVSAKGAPVTLGDYCFVARNTWIGGFGAIHIGANSMIGIGTTIVSSDHDYIDIQTPYYDGSEVPKEITIGENVWIGANCVVLGGTCIGGGSVVAAGSVVSGDFPENSFIVGVPGVMKLTIDRSRPTNR